MIDLGINRDKARIWLDDNNVICSNKDYVLEYMRVGYNSNDKHTIEFIDPSGGPMLSIGDKIGNKKIVGFRTHGYGFKVLMEDISNDNTKYPYQICQDEGLTNKFGELHKKIVNTIISFCKDNSIQIDEFNLSADGVASSIEKGGWTPYTDSSFEFYTDVNKQNKDQKPYLLSI